MTAAASDTDAPDYDLEQVFDLIRRIDGPSLDASDRELLTEELGEAVGCLPDVVQQALDSRRAKSGEAVLTWAGKKSSGLIGARPVPLQTVKSYGQPDVDAGWTNKLIWGDNLGVLSELVRMRHDGKLKNADGTDGFRLVYIDPPFSTRRDFESGKGQVAYRDKLVGADFLEFLRERLVLIHQLLADDGTLWLHLDTKKVHYAKVLLDEIFGEGCFQAEVVWKRTNAKNDKTLRQPGRIHETLLMYTRSATTWVWTKQYQPHEAAYVEKHYCHNDGDGRGPYSSEKLTNPHMGGYDYSYNGYPAPEKGWSCPETTMERLYREGRLKFPSKPTGIIRYKNFLNESPGVQLQDIWVDVSPVARPAYPTQKPAALLERVITASSNPGDLVLDCFMGSGVTCRVAERLGRRWVGVDVGKLSLATVTRDLLTMDGATYEPGTTTATKRKKNVETHRLTPFEVCHAGLYDRDELDKLDHDRWRSFALTVYRFKDQPHRKGDLDLDGKAPAGAWGRGIGVSVLVPRLRTEEGDPLVITRTVLENWAALTHGKVGARTVVAVVTTHTASAPLAGHDELTIDGVAFRLLRVPPATAARLAGLPQGTSSTKLNAVVRAEGFDVTAAPIVKHTLRSGRSRKNAKPTLRIDRFTAIVPHRTGSPPDDGRDDLAMVLVDYDHDQDRFDFEEVHFGDDLAKKAWTITLDADVLARPTLLTFVDIFGNELRLSLAPADFTTDAEV